MSDPVSYTALIVSLVALFATVGQLIQQYFATADGFRRCQASVMGLWAQRTKLRWRWREFRFETVFTIPRIIYGPLHGDVGTKAEANLGRPSLVDSPESLEASMTYPGWGSRDARRYYDSDELACWVPLLAQLHRQGRDIVSCFPQSPDSVANEITVPAIQLIEKSWDFMPSDAVRPMASSTVSDIAIMARRLGQVWKTFDPGAGLMRAEGNGHVITSTLVRSLGTILQYTYTSRDNAANCFYIPAREADKLGFGLVEFDHRLFGPNMPGDLDVGSFAGISRTIHLLIPSRRFKAIDAVLRNISEAINSGKDFIPGFNDLVPLCSAMLSISWKGGLPTVRDRWRFRVPAPNLFMKGVTARREGLQVFQSRLEIVIDSKRSRSFKQSNRILECLQELSTGFGEGWQSDRDWEEQISKDFTGITTLIRYHAEMTVFLQRSRVRYKDLVAEHLIFATQGYDTPRTASRINTMHDPDELDIELIDSMDSYFDFLPKLVKTLTERHRSAYLLDADEIEEAWLTMMFRAFCWQRGHVMIEGVPPLPSEYWNSKMPVYIG